MKDMLRFGRDRGESLQSALPWGRSGEPRVKYSRFARMLEYLRPSGLRT